jgi:hypothetical protein
MNGIVRWLKPSAEVVQGYPDVRCDEVLVDAMTVSMILDPDPLDTIMRTHLVATLGDSISIALFSNPDPPLQALPASSPFIATSLRSPVGASPTLL